MACKGQQKRHGIVFQGNDMDLNVSSQILKEAAHCNELIIRCQYQAKFRA
jgi:hypothetical protein